MNLMHTALVKVKNMFYGNKIYCFRMLIADLLLFLYRKP